MLSFDHFRQARRRFRPRTPAAALRAVSEGFAEVEELVYQGTSVKPLIEEPYDLMELQRVLSRPQLDLAMNILLVKICGQMLGDPDPERALFAAESMTTIETRYAKRIDELKKIAASGDNAVARLGLAREYYELALLSERSPSIRAFYLREAFVTIRDDALAEGLQPALIAVAVRILSALGLHEQAESVLSRAQDLRDPEVLHFRAEVAFLRRDYRTVSLIARHLATQYNRLPEAVRSFIDQWCQERSAEPDAATAGT
jgi:hypothetical protein